jgi:hypothetical protein
MEQAFEYCPPVFQAWLQQHKIVVLAYFANYILLLPPEDSFMAEPGELI